jgi:hypothetical protein
MNKKIRITRHQVAYYVPDRDAYEPNEEGMLPNTIEEMLFLDAKDTQAGDLSLDDLSDQEDYTDEWLYEIVEIDENGKELFNRVFELTSGEDGEGIAEKNAHSEVSETQTPRGVGTVTDADEGIRDYD